MSLSHNPGTYLRPGNGTPAQTLPAAAYEKLKDPVNGERTPITTGKAYAVINKIFMNAVFFNQSY